MQCRCRNTDCDDVHVPSCILLDADVSLRAYIITIAAISALSMLGFCIPSTGYMRTFASDGAKTD